MRTVRGEGKNMFEGFTEDRIDVGDSQVFVRHGGSGPAVMLLHGHPRTSSTWYRVAPLLVDAAFTVVCPDLTGYGRSRGPAPAPDHSAHSKRRVAADMLATMRSLGHDTFDLVGHDRGSYVAFRLTLDHPAAVRRLALLDCIPIVEHLERMDARFATEWWHWFFFAQADKPERAINADPDAWYTGNPERMGAENYEEWRAAVHDPDVVRAMLEDYRAGLTVDRDHEDADRSSGRKVEHPLLVLWSLQDDLEELFGDPLPIWRNWATNVRGHGIDSTHHMAESAPDTLSLLLSGFLREQN
jgi:haloacetate dehalogenase